MKIIALLIVFAIFVLFIEKAANKLLRVEKRKVSETPGKNIDRWGRVSIVVICFFIYMSVLDKDISVIQGFWIFYFCLLFGFQAFMEWKFLKNSKQFVVTLILLIISVALLYNMIYFLSLLNVDKRPVMFFLILIG